MNDIPAQLLEDLDRQAPGAISGLAAWMEAHEHPWAGGARWLATSGLAPRVLRGQHGTPDSYTWGDPDGGPGLRGAVLLRLKGGSVGLGQHLLDVVRAATLALEAGKEI